MLTSETTTTIATTASPGFADITDLVAQAVERSGVMQGRVSVTRGAPGYSLCINERESGLLADLCNLLARTGGSLLPGSPSLLVPVVDGRMYLGVWQRLLLIETSEPCERPVHISVVGE